MSEEAEYLDEMAEQECEYCGCLFGAGCRCPKPCEACATAKRKKEAR